MTRITGEHDPDQNVIYAHYAEKLLSLLGGNRSYKGFQLTALSIEKVIGNPEALTYLCKGLYMDLAARFHTSIYCVERNIRTIRLHIWKHGDRDLLREIFGPDLTARSPGNGVFIDRLSQYVKEHADDTSLP